VRGMRIPTRHMKRQQFRYDEGGVATKRKQKRT
jgi:hypothetical protein